MMLSDLLLATERLRSEKKFLSNMIIKLIGENQQLLGENKQFREEIRSLQYPQQYTRRMMDVMEMEDSRKSKKPKVIKQQQEELCVSRMCDCRLASQRDSLRTTMVHPSIACCDSALTSDFTRTPHSTASESYVEHELERVPKTHLQYWEKKMGEKKGDIFKEQLHILETRAALLEQGKHIERLQMKINRLHDEFRNTGLQGTRQVEAWRKDHCGSWVCEVDIDHLGSQMNKAGKRSYVYIWQTSTNVKKTDEDSKSAKKETEILGETSPEVCQLLKTNLSNGWLEASLNNLKKGDFKVAGENVLGWLRATIENLKEKDSKASTQSLEEWLKESFKNLEIKCPEASRKDVKEWLEISISHLKEEGPDTSYLRVQEWLETSMKSIQELIETSISSLPKEGPTSRAESIQSIAKGMPEAPGQAVAMWLESSMQNIAEQCLEAVREDVKTWLESSITNLQEKNKEIAHPIGQKSREASIKSSQESLEIPPPIGQKSREASIKSTQESPEISHPSRQKSRKVSIKSSPESIEIPPPIGQKSREASIKSTQESPEISHPIEQESPEVSIKSSQESIEIPPPIGQKSREASIKSTQESVEILYPTGQERRKSSLKSIQEGSREISDSTLRENIEAFLESKSAEVPLQRQQDVLERPVGSLKTLDMEGPGESRKDLREEAKKSTDTILGKEPEASRQDQQELLKILVEKHEVKGPANDVQEWLSKSIRSVQNAACRIKVQKWLEDTLENLETAGSDIARQSLQEWLKASIQLLKKEGPQDSIGNVEGWLEQSIENLKQEASRLYIQEWLEESLQYLQEEDPGLSKQDVMEWVEKSLQSLNEICPEPSREVVKKWLESSLKSLRDSPQDLQDLQDFLESSVSKIRKESIVAFRESNMDWLQVPEWTANIQDSSEKMQRNISRKSIYQEEPEEPNEEPEEDITSQILTPDQEEFEVPREIQVKQHLTIIWDLISLYRENPFQLLKHILILISLIVLISFLHKQYRKCCVPCLFRDGLRPL